MFACAVTTGTDAQHSLSLIVPKKIGRMFR